MTAESSVTLDADGLAEASGILTVYNFDPETGLSTGSSPEYLAKGVGIPASSTHEAPPDDVAGMACIFKNGKWTQIADHRGEEVYSTTTGLKSVITELGDYPADVTRLAPSTSFDKWDGSKWVTDETAQKLSDVNAASQMKASLINEANSTTQAWQVQLLLGMITDADKAALTSWMTYIQAVQAVDTSSAPAVTWPVKPDS